MSDLITEGVVRKTGSAPFVDDIEELLAQAKSAKLAAARADGDDREILFEEPQVLVTGVPRSDDFGKWEHKLFEPQYPDRYAATTPRARKGDDDSTSVPAPSEWKPIRVQVAAPNENTGDPGRVVEAEYAAAGGEVRVRYDGKVYAEAIKPGDDPVAVSRRLLRGKWDKHGGDFYAPIRYPTKGYH